MIDRAHVSFQIFCSRCSSHSAPLPRYGQMKPVRVCTHCYMFHVTPFYSDRTGIWPPYTNLHARKQAHHEFPDFMSVWIQICISFDHRPKSVNITCNHFKAIERASMEQRSRKRLKTEAQKKKEPHRCGSQSIYLGLWIISLIQWNLL